MRKLSIVTMAGNTNLHAANRAKKDEFYTQEDDISNELKHYKAHFAGRTVFCNCDDPFESNFFRFFALNFNAYGLKRLIATCYDGSPVAGTQLSAFDSPDRLRTGIPHKIVITEVTDNNGDGAINLADVEWLIKNDNNVLTRLNGNGDFRSPECVELLREADIVVTNPPFSLFREYVAQLVEFDKKFLIIGNMNAVTYKEIFPLIKGNRMWLGSALSYAAFKVPSSYEEKSTRFWIDESGQKWRSMGNICWFTNLDVKKRHENLILYKTYSPQEYPKYDNYDAINVDKTADIPCDYDGVMGVPITFLDKYNPEQFEILGIDRYIEDNPNYGHRFKINDKEIYARILIRKIKK